MIIGHYIFNNAFATVRKNIAVLIYADNTFFLDGVRILFIFIVKCILHLTEAEVSVRIVGSADAGTPVLVRACIIRSKLRIIAACQSKRILTCSKRHINKLLNTVDSRCFFFFKFIVKQTSFCCLKLRRITHCLCYIDSNLSFFILLGKLEVFYLVRKISV